MILRFDDSLEVLAKVIVRELGLPALESGRALRDAKGALAFFLHTDECPTVIDRISALLIAELGPYARRDRVLANLSDFGVSELFNSAHLIIKAGEYHVKLIDRRLVGSDWLREPVKAAPLPPRFVFASLKGGVGRSTALSIVAADFAAKGRRVLAVDLDMEAPGLGALLLNDDTLPEFGIIDALVENNFGSLDQDFYSDMVGPSTLPDGHGKVDVIPAFGRRSNKNPADVLSKISRAYIEDVDENGKVSTLTDQIEFIINGFADPLHYDVILLDARSGLNETTAASILGLGAEVLLFGLNDVQTFQGYLALFSHLARFIVNDRSPEWLSRLTMVQAKAPLEKSARQQFRDKVASLFSDSGLIRSHETASTEVLQPAEPFVDVPWDEDSDSNSVFDDDGYLNESLAILEDERFRHFEPSSNRDILTQQVYEVSYGPFIKYLNQAFFGENVVTS